MSRKINFYGKEPYICKIPEGRFPQEHNDCVVRAASLASGLDYTKVHMDFVLLGRQFGRGTADSLIFSWLQANGFTRISDNPNLTIGRWLRDFRHTGRYFVLIRGHAVAVIDGNLVDWNKPSWRSIWLLK